jgi:hypothetical protein
MGKDFESDPQLQCSRKPTRFHQPIHMKIISYYMDSALMRMLLLARGEPVNKVALLEYQKHTLGAFSGNVCLTELFPLPAPSHRQWPYADHENLPAWMRNREQFMQTVLPGRAATLREKIALHHPRAVVFYFWKPRSFAEAVAGGELQPIIPEKLLGLERNGTAYFITGHPAEPIPTLTSTGWASISTNTAATCLPSSTSRSSRKPSRSPPPRIIGRNAKKARLMSSTRCAWRAR